MTGGKMLRDWGMESLKSERCRLERELNAVVEELRKRMILEFSRDARAYFEKREAGQGEGE